MYLCESGGAVSHLPFHHPSARALRAGRECRRCSFVYAEAKEKGPRDYRKIAERAWVTRRERYGPSGVRPQDRYSGIEMFS
jgi:hypothetical protein